MRRIVLAARRRVLLALLAGGAAAGGAWSPPAHSQEAGPAPWQPSRTPEFIVPGGAGAALDLAARQLTEILARENLAPPFVVTNKPGAHSIQALEAVYRQGGDAHTLATLSSGYVTSQAQGALPPHLQTLTPLATLFREFVAVVVRADSPLHSAQDLAGSLRQDPGGLSIGIANTLGNHIHLGVAQPLRQAGVEIRQLRIVPYKSSAESMGALIGGHLDVVAATTPNLVPYLQSGRVRVLAIGSPQRLSGAFAQAPTWKEQGIDYVNNAYQGVMTVPGATPAQKAYWVEALRRATQTRQWQDFVALNQWEPVFLGPEETASAIRSEVVQTHALLDELGLIPPGNPRVARASSP
ncbi:Bug family tripartite tricarboxylate transporter substrate binding protein [Bordetella sp. 2513F-2]